MKSANECAKWFVRKFLSTGSFLTDKELEELKMIPNYQAFLTENPPKQHGANYEVNIHTKSCFDCHMHSISAHYISVHQKFINKQQPC